MVKIKKLLKFLFAFNLCKVIIPEEYTDYLNNLPRS